MKAEITKEVKKEVTQHPSTIGKLSSKNQAQQTLNILKVAKYLKEHNLLPESFKTVEEATIALQVGLSLGFDSFGSASLAIKNMYLVKGSIHLFGELPLTLVRRSKELENIDEYFIDKDYERISLENRNLDASIFSAVCVIKRKGDREVKYTLTRKELELSGGDYNEKTGSFKFTVGYGEKKKTSATWFKYPSKHWTRRLRAWALKSSFPDIMMGVNVLEYDGLKIPHTVDEKGLIVDNKEDEKNDFEKDFLLEGKK